MRYDYVIFDFDGTVVDTGEGIFKSLEYALKEKGREIPDLSDMRKFIGPPIHYSFTHYYGVSDDEVGEFIRLYRQRYKEKGIYECEPYSGIKELLIALGEKGIKVGVASSKPQHLIYSVSDHLGITELFDAIVGVQVDDSTHATKTFLVLEAMEKLGVRDKSKVLMVGDRLYDIDGAKGAEVSSCGVLWGYGNAEEFREHGADYIIAAPEEILGLL